MQTRRTKGDRKQTGRLPGVGCHDSLYVRILTGPFLGFFALSTPKPIGEKCNNKYTEAAGSKEKCSFNP